MSGFVWQHNVNGHFQQGLIEKAFNVPLLDLTFYLRLVRSIQRLRADSVRCIF